MASLPDAPDVAVVLTPGRLVVDMVEECGQKGIRAAVVISSGFEEVVGNTDLVERLRNACRAHDIALVGPNCEGVWSVRSRVLLTFGSAAQRERLAHRPIAILSQSGSMSGALARHLQDSGFGCAYVVSVGNETVLGVLDYLEYMLEQDDVRVVLLFLEGLKDGSRLLALGECARLRGITLVALKSGNSEIGQQAAASHTGKISTPYAIYRDVLEQAGVIQVQGLTELLEAAEVFSSLPLPRNANSANAGLSVFSIPGGTRALTADLCQQHNVPLARFEEDTVTAIERRIPAYGYPRNPTDITGHVLSDPQLFNDTLGYVAADPNTEALLIQLANRGPRDLRERTQLVACSAAKYALPVVASFLGDALSGEERRAFAEHGIACARDPNDAVRYFSWLYRARAFTQRPAAKPASQAVRQIAIPHDWPGQARLLEEAGIDTPRWVVLAADTAAVEACSQLRFPVVLKALPEDVEHKTELGLVTLDLADASAVDAAARDMRARMQRPDTPLLVQEMIRGGVECILSVARNPDFGAILALGSGGVLVELMRDVGYLCLPVGEAPVRALLDRLKLKRLLTGFRGAPRYDVNALVRAACALGRVFEYADCNEIELNPLIVLPEGQGVAAVDVLVKRGA